MAKRKRNNIDVTYFVGELWYNAYFYSGNRYEIRML
jgi:hypothetical protein